MLYVCDSCGARTNSYDKLSECVKCGYKFNEIKYFKPAYTRTKIKCRRCENVSLVNVKSGQSAECPICHSFKVDYVSPEVATSLKEWRRDRTKETKAKLKVRVQKTTKQLISDLGLLGVPKKITKDIDRLIREAVVNNG